MVEAPIKVTDRRSGLGGKAAILIIAALIAAPGLFAIKGCDDKASANVQGVKIGGKWYHLEVAADNPTRMKGLGQRNHIEPDGGMLFVFPQIQRADPNIGFVMRDCPVDIDIIFLDGAGRIGNWHAMKAETERAKDGSEGTVGQFGETPASEKYENRLKRYPSRFDYQFAIELKGGTLAELAGKFREGEKIDMPVEDLKRRAK
jgi:uncharacterized membrane protein (UPF0127 family)